MEERHTPLNPADIAQLDQILADINNTLNIFITAYTTAATDYTADEAIIGLSQILEEKADNPRACAQYLAVACRRIAQLEEGIRTAHQLGNTPE